MTVPMLPWGLCPGAVGWAASLPQVVHHPQPLWVTGPPGSGVSLLAADLSNLRQVPLLDDSQNLPEEELQAWLEAHPHGVIAGHGPCPWPHRFLELRLAGVEEHPEAIPAILNALGREVGLTLPPALAALPCPGNLRELRNRVVRWKLLGQLPEPPASEAPTFEAEDLATNLHALEAFLLHRALRRSYGNRVEAARRLGVSRRHLYQLVARHGDPLRGEAPHAPPPKRLARGQNASRGKGPR